MLCTSSYFLYSWLCNKNKQNKCVPNFSDPTVYYVSERKTLLYGLIGRLGSLQFNSFRFKASRLLNSLSKLIRNSTSCSVRVFKSHLDNFLSDVIDDPVQTNRCNSLHYCCFFCLFVVFLSVVHNFLSLVTKLIGDNIEYINKQFDTGNTTYSITT